MTLPKLKIVITLKGKCLLIDTRGLVQPLVQTISEKKARAVLFDRPINAVPDEIREEIDWGLKNKLMVTVDSWYVSLVTADPGLINALKKEPQVELEQISR